MAKILTFRGKEDDPSSMDFLAEDNPTLSFSTPEDGGVSLGQIPQANLFPDPRKDWSNQELADLFRVSKLLSSANIPVEVDRGITDEGDPWFVYCHGSGEVFIHMCRIDGMYLLDSPNVARPLQGQSFADLIADFTNQVLPAGADSEAPAERRVIRLERGGKVRLHPSAMLAALIWTLFLASEELVLLAPDAEDDALQSADALLSFEGMFTVDGETQVPQGDGFDADAACEANGHIKHADAETAQPFLPETQSQIREAALQQQGLTAQHNCFSIGLSTIAIAMGFMSEAALLDDQRKILEHLDQLGFAEYGQDPEGTAEVHIAEGDADITLLTMLADFLGIETGQDVDVAEAGARAELSQLHQDITQTIDATMAADEATAKTAAVKDEKIDTETPEAPAERPAKVLDTVTLSKASTAETGQDSDTLSLAEVVKEAQLDLTIKTGFDTEQENAFALFEAAFDTPRLTDIYQYEGLAQRLIDFFKSKGSDLGFIEQANGFVAVDRQAVKSGDIDYIRWETDDGKVIAVIGQPSDFQHFDMIA